MEPVIALELLTVVQFILMLAMIVLPPVAVVYLGLRDLRGQAVDLEARGHPPSDH